MIYCLLKLVNYLVFVDTNGHICDYQVSADLQKFVPGLPFLTPYKHQTHGQRQAHILKTSETNVTHMCPLLKDSNFSADFHRAGGVGVRGIKYGYLQQDSRTVLAHWHDSMWVPVQAAKFI